ncbi:colicin E1 family microcin immunity protein [Morganella psychrotolerans]|uniref:Colicin transporter n=1 Tax=Morganella psychrotolerans TaxID=368603 RepID=A0A1B8HUP0_9GAMM|nr:colicin E1 family microcin immunity protein [Morganella psychrotolerans]OBU13491.1 colicin transporter [Morganella psychrotolerans]
MTKKYYIENMCWGWVYACMFFYLCWNDDFKYRESFLFISTIGVFLYPVAKWSVEYFFLKFTTRKFWNSGFFIDTPGKMGLLAIYGCSVFLLSIPIVTIAIIVLIIKRLLTK